MSNDVVNVRFTGLGGMGVLSATAICAEVAFRAGCDVKKAEVHGMAQRGGSLSADVRFSEDGQVFSPMIPAQSVDYLVCMEPEYLEAYRGELADGGTLLLADEIDLSQLKSPRGLNVAMLGLLSTYLTFGEEIWQEVLKEAFPEKLHAWNETAFEVGRSARKEAARPGA